MLSLVNKHRTALGALALIALMAATRVHHFGSALSLPDASLAVFFLMGLLTGSLWLAAFLLLEAGLLDYLAVSQFGVSDWCISPAYVFLVPTYAAMWFGGRYCARFESLKADELALRFGVLLLAISVAFLISNGSFYLFSGRYESMAMTQYAEGVVPYFLPYATATLIYAASLFAAGKAFASLLASSAARDRSQPA
ncbi:MAG: hypothetical protein ACU826_07675 [Gammaproteobacteria bacterium]